MCNDETAIYGYEGRCYCLESSEPALPIHTLYISSQDYPFLTYLNEFNRKSLLTDVYKVFRSDCHDLDYDSNTLEQDNHSNGLVDGNAGLFTNKL